MSPAGGQPLPAIGSEAPDFTLRDQNNEEVTLSAFRGRQAVLILFYPLAFTGICTGELCAVRDDLTTFQNDDVQVLTISVDSPYAHKIFAEREGYVFPLLSDFWPHGEVAQRYGSFDPERGIALRGTFLVDRDGVVRYTELNQPGQGRDPQAWRAAIAALGPVSRVGGPGTGRRSPAAAHPRPDVEPPRPGRRSARSRPGRR